MNSNQTMADAFFQEISILRKSCNDFEGIQKKLAVLLNKDSSQDLKDLLTMIEFSIPSYSLDILTTVILASGNANHDKKCQMTSVIINQLLV